MSDVYARLQKMLEPNAILAFNSNYGITLVPYLPAQATIGRTTGYRLYVTATHTRNITENIFVYQRKPVIYENQSYKDDFSGVASPADLEEYAVGAPSDPLKPFFRLHYVDFVFRNIDLLVDALEGLGSDTAELIRAKASFDMLKTIGVINVGTPEASSSSSS